MAKEDNKTIEKKETKKTTKSENIHEVVIKIEGDSWTKAVDNAFKKEQKNVKIDGFRPGKYLEIFMKKISVKNVYF